MNTVQRDTNQFDLFKVFMRKEPVIIIIIIYTIILLKSVCLSVFANGRSQFLLVVSGDVSNCSYRLTVHPLTSTRLSSA